MVDEVLRDIKCQNFFELRLTRVMIDYFRVEAPMKLLKIASNSALNFKTLIFKKPNFLKLQFLFDLRLVLWHSGDHASTFPSHALSVALLHLLLVICSGKFELLMYNSRASKSGWALSTEWIAC